MNRQSVHSGANRYAPEQRMQQMSEHRMQQNARMNSYSRRQDSFPVDEGQTHYSSRAGGQYQWDKNTQNELNPSPSHLYMQGQGGNAGQSLPSGRMADQKGDVKQASEGRHQSHEQDMEIGYEDKPSQISFEGLEKRFQDEILKLVKELTDAEDAENARHRERLIEINNEYHENLLTLRSQQAKRREEVLHRESQARLLQYQQAVMGRDMIERGPADPRGYSTEPPRSYGNVQDDPYRERSQYYGGGRSQGSEERVPYPQGRVYNNTGGRYY